MPTRRKSQVNRRRRTRRVTKRRIRGGGKEDRKTLKSLKSVMDMSSLFNDLPSISRKRLPSVKQVAINEEKYQKALAKTIRDNRKKAKALTVKNVDDLIKSFGNL